MKTSGIAALASAVAASAVMGSIALAQDSSSAVSSGTTVTTNENGVVTRVYTESNTTTNGTMVTSRKVITVTTLDGDGNIVGNTTSESLHSFPEGAEPLDQASSGAEEDPLDDIGEMARSIRFRLDDIFNDVGTCIAVSRPLGGDSSLFVINRSDAHGMNNGCISVIADPQDGKSVAVAEAVATDADAGGGRPGEFSLFGIRIGEAVPGELADKIPEPAEDSGCLPQETVFTPAKKLKGFDRYTVSVTPTSRRVAAVTAKATSDGHRLVPGDNGRKYRYLVEALEKKFGRRARETGWRQYTIFLGGGRSVLLDLRPNRDPDGRRVYATITASDFKTKLSATGEWLDLRRKALAKRREAEKAERRSRVEEALEAL